MQVRMGVNAIHYDCWQEFAGDIMFRQIEYCRVSHFSRSLWNMSTLEAFKQRKSLTRSRFANYKKLSDNNQQRYRRRRPAPMVVRYSAENENKKWKSKCGNFRRLSTDGSGSHPETSERCLDSVVTIPSNFWDLQTHWQRISILRQFQNRSTYVIMEVETDEVGWTLLDHSYCSDQIRLTLSWVHMYIQRKTSILKLHFDR